MFWRFGFSRCRRGLPLLFHCSIGTSLVIGGGFNPVARELKWVWHHVGSFWAIFGLFWHTFGPWGNWGHFGLVLPLEMRYEPQRQHHMLDGS